LPQVPPNLRAAFVLLCAIFVLAPPAQAAGRATALTQGERSLLGAVNDVRSAHGLRPLRIDAALTRAARSYSATMIRTDVFSHGAMAARLASHGARGPAFGENLAWGVGRSASAGSVVRSWMASPGHRANLLRAGWNRIGLGALKGSFQGYHGATVITADFAGR
jgi:uncharacterized protein YkwD